MRPLQKPDIESELSYAYLHAVAAKAGMACHIPTRHSDNHGVDAHVCAWMPFSDEGLEEVDLNIQLKATIAEPTLKNGHYSYQLVGRQRYKDLASANVSIPRILVVLYLPQDAESWLGHGQDELVLRRCAYWVSMRGAAALPDGQDSGVVYIPQANYFDPAALSSLMTRLSQRDIPTYQLP